MEAEGPVCAACSVQDAPSHVAANVFWLEPTAVQEVALKQLMPSRLAPPETVGSPATIVQADVSPSSSPFQVWAYSVGGPPASVSPTAVQNFVPAHDTP